MLESSRGGKFELLPQSETEFFIQDAQVTIIFVKDSQGQVTHYIFRLIGQPDLIVKKIK
jgi:hypothetical protein